MLIVLSGEGPSDLGQCSNAQGICQQPEFVPGPMATLVDSVLATRLYHSPLTDTPDRYHYVSERGLQDLILRRKQSHGSFAFAGKKHAQETGYFHVNAWMLGLWTRKLEQQENDSAIAVLFRDSDGSRSTEKGLWSKKHQSMVSGFQRAGLGDRGVPMLPKPKSEAWLLCAIKNNYQHCHAMEDLPGNDDAPQPAKAILQETMDGDSSAQAVNDWLASNGFDHDASAAQMPSYQAFYERLNNAVTICLG